MQQNKYRYNKKAGALQEAFQQSEEAHAPPAQVIGTGSMRSRRASQALVSLHDSSLHDAPTPDVLVNMVPGATPQRGRGVPQNSQQADSGLDHTQTHRGRVSMFYYTVEEGQRVQVVSKSGKMEVVEGPARIWRRGKTIRQMQHFVAHPGDFLIVRYRDGRQEHVAGPAHLWFDPREHMGVTREEALPISAKEAVVVYSEDEQSKEISRRLVHGPAQFVPKPGEWLHTFSWHGSAPHSDGGYQKVPNALVFQKLWLMPDQMYHDVTDVRTADDAVLTIRLMMFFELREIEKMLETTHDPIGDFINAATSDIIEFISRHDFESFKHNTEKLNDLATYKQLTSRASQCGYHIDKVVYRGYGAPAQLQKMHDEAIESRTRLALERATEQQAQELEDFQLERNLLRNVKARAEQKDSVAHDLGLEQKRHAAELERQRAQREFVRQQTTQDAQALRVQQLAEQAAQREHLEALRELGVDLTALLTHSKADRIIELRGDSPTAPHLHLEP